jgi:starch phosphorylase
MGGRIAFVEKYDEQLAQYLVHGVDTWLNNPLPPMEACGTSGMKASLNGVPQMSIPDGWWIEGFNGRNGWTFGEEYGNENGEDRDKADADALYDLLETKIIPLYYDTNDNGIPLEWVKVMKEAMKSVGADFSTRRMAKEYVRKFYRDALDHVH